ncbi:MAG: FecR family protein [Dongiaceae bacterium]
MTAARYLLAPLTLSILMAVPDLGIANPIASVQDLVNNAMRVPPGAPARVRVRVDDELVQDERVQTMRESAMQLIFLDGSEMHLDESSDLVLTRYVFDPDTQSSNALLKLGAGVFRFVSAGKKDEGVLLQTPAATIGIRGTDIIVTVSVTGATKVSVLEGQISLKPSGLGAGTTVTAGQVGSVANPNADASVSEGGPAGSSGSSADAGGGGSASGGSGGGGDHSGGGAASGGGGGGGSGGSSGGSSGGGGSSAGGGSSGGGAGDGGSGDGGSGDGGSGNGGSDGGNDHCGPGGQGGAGGQGAGHSHDHDSSRGDHSAGGSGHGSRG